MSLDRDCRREIRRALDGAAEPGAGVRARAAPVVIGLENVWLRFDEPVLCGVDLRVREGETRVVLGESGSGKSTILKIILRLLVPDRGTVRVFGRDIVDLPYEEAQEIRRHIGMVFQYAALFDSLTVFENVAYPLRENTRLGEAQIERIVRERLRFVDLDPDQIMAQLPGQLSGGMRKRVGIARAIAADPAIVLYDEPTAGLDPLAVDTIIRLTRKLQLELGVTSIVVTHDIRTGFRIASYVSLLRDGKIRFEGTPEEMLGSDDPYLRAFLG